MAQKGRDSTQSSGGRSARPDPFLHSSERLSPASNTDKEDNPWTVQGRGRERAGMSTRAARLAHPHTTPPNSKSTSTVQHTKPSPAAQRAMASAAQAQQHASNPASVASPVQHPSSNVAPEPLPEVGDQIRRARPTRVHPTATTTAANGKNKQRLNHHTTTRPCTKPRVLHPQCAHISQVPTNTIAVMYAIGRWLQAGSLRSGLAFHMSMLWASS